MIYKLKDLIKIKYGKNQKKVECEAGCYHIIGTGGIIGKAKEYLYDKPSVLIGRKGTIDKVRYIDEPFWTIDTLFYTEINEKIVLPKYLYYKLSMINFKNYNEGTTIPSLKTETLYEIEVDIDDMTMQKKIVKILSKLEDKIKLNNQINDNLLKLNNQLYEEYFINNINQYDDEINLKDLINVVNGYSYKGIELVDKSDTCLATIKNFDRKGSFKEDGFKPLNPQRIKEEQIVEKNDILVACTDLTQQADIIGNAVLLLSNGKYKKIIISMDLVKIIPKDNINKYVIFSILNSKDFKNFALGYRSGTTVLHLNKKCFNDYKFKMPDNKKLNIFSNIVRMNYERISSILEENRKLNELRDTLLPKLMNGEINLDKIKI